MGTQDALKSQNLTVLQTIYQTSFQSRFPAFSLSVLCHRLFLHLPMPLTHWTTVCFEVASPHLLFSSGKDPCMCHKYLSY